MIKIFIINIFGNLLNYFRDFEIQKALLILEDSKNMKLPIANNLKRVQLEKMKNSLNPAQVK